VVITTLSVMTIGVDGQTWPVRIAALAIAIPAGAGSIALAQKRSNVMGWYVISVGVAVFRLLAER
jgi:hypothetical protein